MDDYSIIKSMKYNNEKAIEKLIDKYSWYVARVIFKVGGTNLSVEDIEEISSDVFYAVWKSRENILELESVKPYLAQIARNMTKNKFGKIKNDEALNDEFPLNTKKNDDLIIEKEKISIIKNVLDTLKQLDKDILYTYYFKDYKLEDIAKMYEIPLSTVKSKVYRARKVIIRNFKERGYSYED